MKRQLSPEFLSGHHSNDHLAEIYVNDIIKGSADSNILSINASIWILLSIDLRNMRVNYTNIFITLKLA